MLISLKKVKSQIRTTLAMTLIGCTILGSIMPVYSADNETNNNLGDNNKAVFASSNNYSPVDGTTGTPLGGFGTGGVKFDAKKGAFYALTKAPADAYDYKELSGAKFQLYTNRNGSVKTVDTMKSVVTNGRSDDDAIWPMHFANMGVTDNVKVNLKAFSPLDNKNYDNMSMPYAFYEMTLENIGDSSVDASCAFQLTTDDNPSYVYGKGFNGSKWAIYGVSEHSGAVVSVGNDNGFNTDGVLNNTINGKTNKVAVKVSLEANQTATVKFVLAWYDNSDPERHYYLNFYDNPGDIAQRGLDNFDILKNNGEELVNKMRNSNLPDWFRTQIQNTLCNISNNSMYKKDGRVAFAEGQWTCFGTMDQMWHARQIIAQLVPFYAWRELEYWARTQRNDGQIHHDFNTAVEDKSLRSELVAWDYTEHSDYRNVDKWVDLNCGLIISVYETMQIAGNPLAKDFIKGKDTDTISDTTTVLDYFWPYMKKAGDRILKQVELYGNKEYPYTFDDSENSYDAGGNPNPFNASVSAVAYDIMARIATERGETDEADKYTTAYNTVKESFAARYLNNNFPEDKRVSESFLTGQWLSMHLKLGQIWTDEQTDYALEQLDSFYHPYYWGMGTLKGTYNEWTPYSLVHYGGLLLHTRRENIFEAYHRDSYKRQYDDRNQVFNHQLGILPAVTTPNYNATNISGDKQYISMPSLWRNYNDVVGYYRDQRSKDIWVQPRLLPEMNDVMTDGLFIMPEGYGTVSCTESGDLKQNQSMTVKSENAIDVKKIHLSDNFGETAPTVKINGTSVNFERIGTGYDKELVVEYNGTLDSNGITIETEGEAGYTLLELPEAPSGGPDDTPSGALKDAYSSIAATTAETKTKVDVETPTGQEWYVRNQDNYDNHIIFENVEFGEIGSNTIVAKVASDKAGFTLKVELDTLGSGVIGTINVPDTGGEQTWKEVTCILDKTIKGNHSIAITFDANGPLASDPRFVNLNSIKFLQADGRLDRSLWKVTASKNSSSISAIIDGDINTNWHGSYQEIGKNIVIDFGKTEKFNKITLENVDKNKGDHPKGFNVYISQNGSDFGKPIVSGNTTNDAKLNIKFDDKEARYIKIEISDAETSKYWRIAELNVFYEEPITYPESIIGIFAGTGDKHPINANFLNPSKYNTGTKSSRINENSERAVFVDGISDELKAIFADPSNDTQLDLRYSSYYLNYIGKSGDYDNKPAIENITLPAGDYTVYYFGGGSDKAVIIDLPDTKADNVIIDSSKEAYKFATIGSKNHSMKEINITLKEDYTGDITFYNDSDWLPDLYSVTIKSNQPIVVEPKTEIKSFNQDTGTVTFIRGKDLPDNAVVIVAGYSSKGILTDIKTAQVGAGSEVTVGKIVGDSIKVCIWESIENMIPLCNTYTK